MILRYDKLKYKVVEDSNNPSLNITGTLIPFTGKNFPYFLVAGST
jgi:hypothetical protein